MTELSKLVYKTSKGELRIEELTEDAAAIGRFELSPQETLAVRRSVESGQWLSLGPSAIGGWW